MEFSVGHMRCNYWNRLEGVVVDRAAAGGVLRVHLRLGPLSHVQPAPPPLQLCPVARVADGVHVGVDASDRLAEKGRRHRHGWRQQLPKTKITRLQVLAQNASKNYLLE